MFTVTVCLLASGNNSTRRPLARRYSVMPSTEVTRSGGAGGAGGGSGLILRASLTEASNMAQQIANASNGPVLTDEEFGFIPLSPGPGN